MKLLFSGILFFVTLNLFSQSILTALNFGKNEEFHSSKLVAETIIQTTFYNSTSIEKTMEITSYNKKNKILSELRYDEFGNLKQRLVRLYDSTGIKSLARRLENWHPLLGYSFETAIHEYDSRGFLIRVIDKDENNKIVRETIIKNDDKGYPIELHVIVDGQIQGKEVAEYDHERNEVVVKYFNGQGKLINSVLSKIEFTKGNPGNVVNEYGDVIKSADFELDVKYDKNGNWIKKIYYKIKDGKPTKKSESTRRIKYF